MSGIGIEIRDPVHSQGDFQKLSNKEKEAIEKALDQNGLSIKEFQLLFPETSKRTLQRELKHLLELGLLKVEGATNDRRYWVNL